MGHSVEARDLAKSYGAIPALRKLSFSVNEGELFGLIGPDGAGKSTFMRIAACLLLQDGGSLTVDGTDTRTGHRHVKRIIGYMPQRFSLYPDLSVKENLLFFADLFGVEKQERTKRMDRLLEFSRLGSFLNRRAEKLSGGMKQKLALSCTLIHTPRVLFLDEPTTGVDPVSRREFWDILGEINHDGATIMVSTPYMDEAERCDRVAFMMNGAILMTGTPGEIPGRFSREILSVHGRHIVKGAREIKFPDDVIDVQTFGDRLHLTVEDAKSAAPRIEDFLRERGFDNITVEQTSPSMEDVFMEHMGARDES